MEKCFYLHIKNNYHMRMKCSNIMFLSSAILFDVIVCLLAIILSKA